MGGSMSFRASDAADELATDQLSRRLDEPAVFSPPENWPMSTAWQRAQRETDHGGALNKFERMVMLSGGDDSHRVLWCLWRGELRAECDCRGWHFNDGWCAHVAACWWAWVRGELSTTDIDTERVHLQPPEWFRRRGGEANP